MMIIYFLVFVRQGGLAYLRTFPLNKKAILPLSHSSFPCRCSTSGTAVFIRLSGKKKINKTVSDVEFWIYPQNNNQSFQGCGVFGHKERNTGHWEKYWFSCNVKTYLNSSLLEPCTHNVMKTLKCSHRHASWRETDATVNSGFDQSATSGLVLPGQVKSKC